MERLMGNTSPMVKAAKKTEMITIMIMKMMTKN